VYNPRVNIVFYSRKPETDYQMPIVPTTSDQPDTVSNAYDNISCQTTEVTSCWASSHVWQHTAEHQ